MKHLDSDDFYWKKAEIPYTQKVVPIERVQSIKNAAIDTDRWILSGSMCSWGDSLITEFTHMIYLTAKWELRRERLLERQTANFGLEALCEGGEMYQVHRDFIEWASRYDTTGREQRSKATHEAWIAALPDNMRLLRIDGSRPKEEVLSLTIDQLNSKTKPQR